MRLALLLVLLLPVSAWGYLTDHNTHTEPTAPTLSAAGSTATDPTFGSDILRLTDSGDSTTDCFTVYSNSPALNVNSTKIVGLCAVSYERFKVWDFDAATMTRSNPRIQSNSPASFQDYSSMWSKVTYNKFYGCARMVLYEITIPDGTSTTWTNTVVHDFTTELGGQAGDTTDYCTQISISADDNVFGFHYVLNGSAAGYVAYKRSTDTTLLQQTLAGVNEVEIDKSGQYLSTCCLPQTRGVWDLSGTPSFTAYTWGTNHRAMLTGKIVMGCSTNNLCIATLSSPNSTTKLLTDGEWPYGSNQDHYSGQMTGDNWIMSCRYKTNGEAVSAAFDNECLAVATDGSKNVRRYVHNRSNVWGGDYDAQPKGNISLDGQFIAWTSNWDGANTSTRNDVYVAKIAAGAPPPGAFAQTYNVFHGLYGTEASPDVRRANSLRVVAGGKFRLRVKVACTLGDCPQTGFQLRYSKNGGAYTVIPDTFDAANIQYLGTSTVTDVPDQWTATTEQLTSDQATNIPGAIIRSTAAVLTVDLSQNSEMEFEVVLQLDTDITDGDTYDFRVYAADGTQMNAYNTTPRVIAVTMAGGAGY